MLTPEFLKAIEALHAAGTPFCAVRLVDGAGSMPQVIGASALFTADGLVAGTVGGGRLEARCQETAQDMLAQNGPAHRLETWNLQTDVGMTCGGKVALFFEVYRPDTAWHIVVFGAGHVAQKLCAYLVDLDCTVTCVDTRAEWLDKLPHHPRLETCLVESYADGVARIAPHSYVILMTMGHHADVPVLQAIEAAAPDAPYIGVIGSDQKALILKKDLAEAGVAKTFINRVVCPIGAKVANNTPPEIAFTVIAQLLEHRRAPEVAARLKGRKHKSAQQSAKG